MHKIRHIICFTFSLFDPISTSSKPLLFLLQREQNVNIRIWGLLCIFRFCPQTLLNPSLSYSHNASLVFREERSKVREQQRNIPLLDPDPFILILVPDLPHLSCAASLMSLRCVIVEKEPVSSLNWERQWDCLTTRWPLGLSTSTGSTCSTPSKTSPNT